MSLALLFHYLMFNMFRMLIHPSPGACDLFVELFHGLYCSGTMCVGVTLWFGWGGLVSGCRLQRLSAVCVNLNQRWEMSIFTGEISKDSTPVGMHFLLYIANYNLLN